ncbi:MAG: transcriptional regulator [Thiothrix sp.]|uniref:HVO_A0114 family putative DNA-binding protein n=1 Tax=Thiothrix sp. TaxID=1032 RepID=UPI0026334B65|nr:transcriptional regulator [Thiothrix sp.]MDD5392114.1 transcriptional regulator [Thiothrix sp.]
MNRKLIISITSETDAMQDFKAGFLQAFNTGSYQDEHIYFTSPTALFQKITPKRWELIAKLQEVGTVSIRELARLLGRDIRRVHDDTIALIEEGVIERNGNGVCVPFAEIHTDFSLKAKAA